MPQTSAITEDDVRRALAAVVDPELRRPIMELNMIRGIVVVSGQVHVSVALAVEGYVPKAELHDDVISAVKALGAEQVFVDFTIMTDDQRTELRRRLHGEGAVSIG
ncbi:MAG: iron-sulfur cluster assembly protein, partial [Actinomycetota bacterium]